MSHVAQAAPVSYEALLLAYAAIPGYVQATDLPLKVWAQFVCGQLARLLASNDFSLNHLNDANRLVRAVHHTSCLMKDKRITPGLAANDPRFITRDECEDLLELMVRAIAQEVVNTNTSLIGNFIIFMFDACEAPISRADLGDTIVNMAIDGRCDDCLYYIEREHETTKYVDSKVESLIMSVYHANPNANGGQHFADLQFCCNILEITAANIHGYITVDNPNIAIYVAEVLNLL